MLLQNRFNQVDAQILSTEEQIRQLQDSLSQLQQHRQHLQSVEQACESALTQVDTALMMLNHVDPDCIATFKDAIMTKLEQGVIAQLPSSPDDDEPEAEPTPEPIEPTDEVITVESEPTKEPTEPTPSPRIPTSVGSAAFNIKSASIDELKAFCSSISEEQARTYGVLTRKSTWQAIAKAIINGTLN